MNVGYYKIKEVTKELLTLECNEIILFYICDNQKANLFFLIRISPNGELFLWPNEWC